MSTPDGQGPAPAPRPFTEELRARRMEMADPKTGKKPISQRSLSKLLGIRRDGVYEYENGVRVPHELVRRELKRFFPGIFGDEEAPPAPDRHADRE